MVLNRLNPLSSTALRFINRNLLLGLTTRNNSTITTKNHTKVDEELDEEDEPIQYSTSPAATWAARHSQSGENDDDTPWYQPHIVAFSTLSFLIYFGYLRESNDIDDIFDMELGDHFPNFSEEELQKKFGAAIPIPRKKTSE